MGESAAMTDRLRIAIWLDELGLPFDDGLRVAAEVGSEYVWFTRLPGETAIADMTDAEVDDMARRVEASSRKLFTIGAGHVFHNLRLTDLAPGRLREHEGFRHDFDALVRSMEIAARLGVGGVCAYAFHWPGEGTGWQEAWSRSPTWPMRWLTRGGHIAPVDMDKLVKAFSLVAQKAEDYGVDVALSMMCWNYTNTTGNFRRVAEAVGSKRLKVMWGPADNTNCGEADVATAGFLNVRPYLYGLHLKDLRVNDGLALDFDYCPIGTGAVDYPAVLRNLRDHNCDVYLSVATHFVPASGSKEEAMRINYANLRGLIDQL